MNRENNITFLMFCSVGFEAGRISYCTDPIICIKLVVARWKTVMAAGNLVEAVRHADVRFSN